MIDRFLLRKIARGVVGGAIATVAMSGVMALGAKAHALGEPPPRKLVRKTAARVGIRPRRKAIDMATVAAHLAFGMSMGALYSLLPGRKAAVSGALFGLGVWTTSYAGWIPALRLMAPPKRDRPGRPTTMLVAHLVYGAILGAAQSGVRDGLNRGKSSRSGRRASEMDAIVRAPRG